MEAWRSDWDDLAGALNSNTLTSTTADRRRLSPTKSWVVDDASMVAEDQLQATAESDAMRALDTALDCQLGAPYQTPPPPQPEPEAAPSEGVPPPQAAGRSVLAVPLANPASEPEQFLLALAREEGRPPSVAAAPTGDSVEQDLLRRTGLAPPATAAGVGSVRHSGREAGTSGDVVTVALKKVYDPLAMPGMPRPSSEIQDQLAALLARNQAEEDTTRRREAWSNRGWSRYASLTEGSTTLDGSGANKFGPGLAATRSYQAAAADDETEALDTSRIFGATDGAASTDLGVRRAPVLTAASDGGASELSRNSRAADAPFQPVPWRSAAAQGLVVRDDLSSVAGSDAGSSYAAAPTLSTFRSQVAASTPQQPGSDRLRPKPVPTVRFKAYGWPSFLYLL